MNVRLRTKKKVAPLNRAALWTEDGARLAREAFIAEHEAAVGVIISNKKGKQKATADADVLICEALAEGQQTAVADADALICKALGPAPVTDPVTLDSISFESLEVTVEGLAARMRQPEPSQSDTGGLLDAEEHIRRWAEGRRRCGGSIWAGRRSRDAGTEMHGGGPGSTTCREKC
jgi:hypothetical protein